MDAIYDSYVDNITKDTLTIDDLTEAHEDLQDTLKQEILFKISQALDDYNIEPRKLSK